MLPLLLFQTFPTVTLTFLLTHHISLLLKLDLLCLNKLCLLHFLFVFFIEHHILLFLPFLLEHPNATVVLLREQVAASLGQDVQVVVSSFLEVGNGLQTL